MWDNSLYDYIAICSGLFQRLLKDNFKEFYDIFSNVYADKKFRRLISLMASGKARYFRYRLAP